MGFSNPSECGYGSLHQPEWNGRVCGLPRPEQLDWTHLRNGAGARDTPKTQVLSHHNLINPRPSLGHGVIVVRWSVSLFVVIFWVCSPGCHSTAYTA